MAIPTDPERKEELARIVGRRLRNCRKMAGLTQAQVAAQLKQKGITQISLAEDGSRLPPLVDMVKYAQLYKVPMDFLVALVNDPLAEAGEVNQAMMIRAVAGSVGGLFEKFVSAVAGNVSVSLANVRQDRADLIEMIELGLEAERAMERIRELNPEFDDSVRGGNRIDATLMRIASLGRRMESRTREERRQREMIDRVLELDTVTESIREHQLQFSFVDRHGAGVNQVVAEAVSGSLL